MFFYLNNSFFFLLFCLGTNTKAIHQCGRRLLLLAKSRLLMMPKNLDLNSEKHRKEALQVRIQVFFFFFFFCFQFYLKSLCLKENSE